MSKLQFVLVVVGVMTTVRWDVMAAVRTSAADPQSSARQADGDGSVQITGELRQWHAVTLTVDGPFVREQDEDPNPFTDYRMTVTFTHESGKPTYEVPGYFAADGDAANTSADSGNKWRAHLSPDLAGQWNYRVSFVRGKHAAIDPAVATTAVPECDGKAGTFQVLPTDKTGRDFRSRGRLQYVGQHYLQFAGSGEYFLKAGPDAPETLLAYADFDNTQSGRPRKAREGEAVPTDTLHHYEPHVADWSEGDPTWKGDKGKGLIGALNYLSSKGVNAFSFLPYNAGGDGDNVWPFVERAGKLHYDCSKLDQWNIVFSHATQSGLYLHFKLQENEVDDNRVGHKRELRQVPESLDGGALGVERKLYCRELVARFAHHLALNWNLGEENTQSPEEQRAMAQYLRDVDPYDHHIVVHTFPGDQDRVYGPLLGDQSVLTGASLQNSWRQAHQRTLKWVRASAEAGKLWVVANDEQNPASHGVPPDPGYEGHNGVAKEGDREYTLDDIRKNCLWGTLMAGGAGVEYYFGYQLPQNDLVCEDWRSRDRSWDYCRIALKFFQDQQVPFWEMSNQDALVGNQRNDNSRYCFAKPGSLYLVYLPDGGTASLGLEQADGIFSVKWYDPRHGGDLSEGSVTEVRGGSEVSLGQPPRDDAEDWLIVVRRR